MLNSVFYFFTFLSMHPFVTQLATFLGVLIAVIILLGVIVILWKGVVFLAHLNV